MDEYIEREAAIESIMSDPTDAHYPSWYADKIKEIPTADVATVRRGRWIMRGGKRYCSECGDRACVTRDSDDFWYTVGTDFCPSCGAKMDGGNDG